MQGTRRARRRRKFFETFYVALAEFKPFFINYIFLEIKCVDVESTDTRFGEAFCDTFVFLINKSTIYHFTHII